MAYLVPLNDRLRVSRDGAEQLHGVALLSHVAVEIVGGYLGGTCKRRGRGKRRKRESNTRRRAREERTECVILNRRRLGLYRLLPLPEIAVTHTQTHAHSRASCTAEKQ